LCRLWLEQAWLNLLLFIWSSSLGVMRYRSHGLMSNQH
jgi:hypothetical protein